MFFVFSTVCHSPMQPPPLHSWAFCIHSLSTTSSPHPLLQGSLSWGCREFQKGFTNGSRHLLGTESAGRSCGGCHSGGQFITSAHSMLAKSSLIRKRLETCGSLWMFHDQERSLPLTPARPHSPGELPFHLTSQFSPPQPAP